MTILRTTRLMSLLAVLVLTGRSGARAASEADRPPNIIVFVSDDHRADVLGCAGHAIVETPNIDKLAAEGVRFSNAFVTTSICAASRATILTGVVERTHRFTFGTPPLARPFCEDSYPWRLRERGYRTGFVGKLGVSVAGGGGTLDRMFDSFVPLDQNPYVKTMPDGSMRHTTDITGDRAIEFIRSNPTGQPFCLSVSFNAAHAQDGDFVNHFPCAAAEADLYRDVPMPRPRLEGALVNESVPDFFGDSLNRVRYFWRWDTPEKYERNLRSYFRMISGLDRNIGRVMAELVAQGLEQSTVVIFTGDNGYYMGERGFAGKWSHYEESLRVPLVIRDPGTPPAMRGRVVEAISLNLDLAPAILGFAGLESPARYQGRSLVPFTRTADPPKAREGFFCEHRMKHPQLPAWEGYHGLRYVYATYPDVGAGGELLHDLEQDPRQLRNFVADEEYSSVLERMRSESRRLSELYAAAAEPLPRVLLLGDSISMGYHQFVADGLAGEAMVVRPRNNCEGTTAGLRNVATWLELEGGEFDVIHFNFGLHDLKRVKEPGGRKSSNDPAGPRQADLATYERNLRRIVAMLEATDATLVFATTTPVPRGDVRPHRDVEDPPRYNAAARRIMEEHGVAVNDLYTAALERQDEIQRPTDVHLNELGSRLLATEVVRHIRAALRKR